MRWVFALGAALVGMAACASFGSTDPAANATSPEAGPSDSAAPTLDAAAARFCDGVTGALFCDDFDGDPVFSWPNGSVAPDSDGVGGSPPAVVDGHEGKGIASVVPSNDAGLGPSDFAADKIVIPGTRDLRVEADVFIDPVAAYHADSASIGILSVLFGDVGNIGSAVALVAQSPLQEGAYAIDGQGVIAQQYAQDQIVEPGQWVHLRFDVGLVDHGDDQPGIASAMWGSDASVDATYDGQTNGDLTRFTLPSSANTTVWFGGIRYTGNSLGAPVTVHLDNVVVTAL